MSTISPLNSRQKLLIDGSLLFLLAMLTAGFAAWYVSSEHYFYFWDFSAYQNLALDVAYAFRDSKTKAISSLLESLSWDYNQLFALPLIPFILAFGDSRLVYILSLVLTYLLPFSLIMGSLAQKLIPAAPRFVFWLTALLTLLLPTTWKATLRGYPDIGGVLLISLAVLAYLQDIRLKQRWQIPVIGILLALTILFRRHFVYSILAFLTSILEQLLQAQYVIVAQPFQKILGTEQEQDVVKVVFDAFTQNWEIAQDFQRLPVEFTLDRGTVVHIYQRTRSTSLTTAVRTLHRMQQQIGERPGGQMDWIVLNHHSSKIIPNLDKTYNIETHFSYQNQFLKKSYLYIGRIPPKNIEVTGIISLDDNKCFSSGVSLQLLLLSNEGKILRNEKILKDFKNSSNFTLSIQHSNAEYLLLDVLTSEKNEHLNSCYFKIQNLSLVNKDDL